MAALDSAKARTTSSPSIDIESPAGLRRWSAELMVPGEALEAAVLAVGTRLDRVKDYLAAGSAGTQQDG